MLNVNGIKRNAKNIVKKYSDAQVKVREATSNDPWGPSSTIMAEIADLTNNVVAFSEIMQMIWKRLNDHGKNWRHVYKALVLLEYLIKTGNDKVAQQCTENIFAIQTLKDFQFMEDNKDIGLNIREKSKKLVALLKDSDKLKAERARALKAKARLAESMSSVSKNSLGLMMSSSLNNGDNPISSTTANGNGFYQHNESGGSSSSAALADPELDSARPQTATEEENQLKLALALSKEEAEQQEKTRKNDELRLKLALDVSKKSNTTPSSSLLDDFNEPSTSTGKSTASQPLEDSSQVSSTTSTGVGTSSQPKSAIDDLLGLSIPAPNEALPAATIASTSFTSATISNAFTSNPSILSSQSLNPTGGFAVATPTTSVAAIDPIASIFAQPSSATVAATAAATNDPWSSDPWQVTSNTSAFFSSSSSSSTIPNYTATSTATTAQQQSPFSALQSGFMSTLTSTTAPSVPVVGSTSNNLTNGNSTNGFFNTDHTKRPAVSKNPFADF